MPRGIFKETSRRMANSASLRVREINIHSKEVADVLDKCRILFLIFDRNDPSQIDLIRGLWELRLRVMFSMLPFDSESLGLLKQFTSFSEHALRVPEAVDVTHQLSIAVQNLIRKPENPKYLWLMTNFSNSQVSDGEDLGLLTSMVRGRTVSLPETIDNTNHRSREWNLIDSHQTLESRTLDKMILLGTCQYLSYRFFNRIFYLGCCREIDILLYQGERFYLKDRLRLPDSPCFHGRLTSSRVAISKYFTDTQSPGLGSSLDEDIDKQLDHALWDMAHAEDRVQSSGLLPAYYMLLKDGNGLFVQQGREVNLLVNQTAEGDAHIITRNIEDVDEGDLLLIQPTETECLLDIFSEKEDFFKTLETECDWRSNLEALLLTKTPEEVANAMLEEGAHGNSLGSSVRNWASGEVYGPGSKNELYALLSVLIQYGKIEKQQDMDEYVEGRWVGLQNLRSIRHRAGIQLQQEISCQILRVLRDLGGVVDEIQSLHLENGVQVSVKEVVAVDDRLSWVAPFKLSQLHPVRGGQWLG